MPNTSATICMNRGLFDPPPQTMSLSGTTPMSRIMPSRLFFMRIAIASMIDRYMWPRVCR